MPASPSLPSGTRGNKWKKRKREPQNQAANRRLKDDDDEDDEDEDDLNDREDDAAAEDANPNAPDPNPRETEVLAAGGLRISEFPLVVKRMVNRPHSSVLSIVAAERACSTGESSSVSGIVLENVSYGQLQALSAVPADCSSLTDGEGPSSYVAKPPKLMEGKGVVHRYGDGVLVVPMHSDWFSPFTVHRLERQVVPHFFSGKSPGHTPEKYRECRNRIVAKYMENPDKRLTVSDFPGSVVGVNEDDLARIVRFLDHWGIINYCATSSPTHDPYDDGSYLKEDQNGEVHVPSAALKSIDSLIKFDKPKCTIKDGGVCSLPPIKENGVSDLDNQIRECLSENCCNHCSRPLLAIYYQSQKEVDVFLCVDCFHEGRFVVGHSSIDFFRADSTKANDYLDGESWTDQETLLLLEAMELYGDNWNGIAEHVGTKTKAQCILHFVRLPMENGLLEKIEVPGAPNLSSGDDQRSSHSHTNGNLEESSHQDDDTEDRIPFANSSNPVMALVAFLASAVAPRVAAECAHAALAALSGEAESGNDIQAEGSVQGQSMNVEAKSGDSVQQKGGQTEADTAAAVSPEKVKAAARIGLSAAATKAKLFADHEEREIQRLYATIINQQLKRLELKLKQFAEVETLLMRECDQMEKGRQRLVAERARIVSSRLVPTPTGGPPLSNLGPTNPRPPVMSSPSSLKPSMSGFGGAQIPSQMPFMPPRQQQMFPLGPRLPLSAINSSSPSASVGFNGQGSSQNAPLNHPMMRSLSGTSTNLG